MGVVVNLNKFRKKKAREEKQRRAETNRRLHGRTQAERDREALQKQRLTREVEGAFLVRREGATPPAHPDDDATSRLVPERDDVAPRPSVAPRDVDDDGEA